MTNYIKQKLIIYNRVARVNYGEGDETVKSCNKWLQQTSTKGVQN